MFRYFGFVRACVSISLTTCITWLHYVDNNTNALIIFICTLLLEAYVIGDVAAS